MKILEYINRINLINKLIQQKRTGTPENFAKKLGISTIRLYQIIEELKIMQVPIIYCKKNKTYFYKTDYEMNVNISFKSLSDSEIKSINGGLLIKKSLIYNFLKL